MPRSKFSGFKHGVRMNLIKRCHWKPDKATQWIRANRDYMRAMWLSAAPTYETAISIDKKTKDAEN